MNADVMGAKIDPFYGAPVVLVVLADKSVGTYKHDGSLVMKNLMLAANAVGLGSCWIHRARKSSNPKKGREFLRQLGISGDYEGIGHCILAGLSRRRYFPPKASRKENWGSTKSEIILPPHRSSAGVIYRIDIKVYLA